MSYFDPFILRSSKISVDLKQKTSFDLLWVSWWRMAVSSIDSYLKRPEVWLGFILKQDLNEVFLSKLAN